MAKVLDLLFHPDAESSRCHRQRCQKWAQGRKSRLERLKRRISQPSFLITKLLSRLVLRKYERGCCLRAW